MKKVISMALALLLAAGLLSVNALAADVSPAGAYNLTVTEGYTLTPQDASGQTIQAAAATVDGNSVSLYPAVERFTLTYSHAGTADFHLALALSGEGKIPTADNLCYIDQSAATNGTVTFTVYPGQMTKGVYHIYLVKTGSAAPIDVASFSYYQPFTPGDVNDDKKINSADALLALQSAVSKVTLTNTQFLAADVTKDSKVNSADALKILQYAVEKITSFD